MPIGQLNVDIEKEELRKIKKDAVEMGVPLKDYTATVLNRFRSTPIDKRRAVFVDVPKKIAGRKARV